MNVLAFDLGSNTLRAVLYDCNEEKSVGEYERIVKTADGLATNGKIDEAALLRVIEAIGEALRLLDSGADVTVAYATEALRRATNREEVLRRIAEQTGVYFDVIDGEKEARLTLRALKRRLAKLGKQYERFVAVDIGGGSTELAVVCGKRLYARSFPIGIVTVAQTYSSLETIQKAMEELTVPMRRFVKEVYANCGSVDVFVATAGTPTTVAAMKLGQTYATYDAKAVNGTILTKDELRIYLERLLAMPKEKREETVGVGRDDLIAAGIMIFEAIFDVLGLRECVVIDDGLREGAAMEACEKSVSSSLK